MILVHEHRRFKGDSSVMDTQPIPVQYRTWDSEFLSQSFIWPLRYFFARCFGRMHDMLSHMNELDVNIFYFEELNENMKRRKYLSIAVGALKLFTIIRVILWNLNFIGYCYTLPSVESISGFAAYAKNG
ncbi:hypothetical protein T01_12403 [Trichinella spiralis]|uniref:Uncharacterized protein n=1 Tax=Trichinella spiralis TaxID=6334 RepID=A0A0V1AX69_TRISP|nr:hypothetical protein T01_12403 [Trichinella spiralis]